MATGPVLSGASAASPASKRGALLTAFSILFVLLAISDILKPLRFEGSDTGFVFFGQRLSGTANAVIGPLFGLGLLVYAVGIWRMKRFALPLGCAYAAYVIINLTLFTVRTPVPPGTGYMVFGVVYAILAVGVSSAAVYLLRKRKGALT